MLLIFITFCLFWFLCWFLEYNKGENGDDYTCFYTEGPFWWRENGNDNSCDNKEGMISYMRNMLQIL